MLKLWTVISACWVGFWSWYFHIPSCGSLHLGEDANIGWRCNGPVAETGGYEIVPLVVVVAGDYRYSNRRVADRCRHLFVCLPRPTLKYKIVAARICVLPWSLTAQRSSVDRIICIARFGFGQSTEAIEREQKAYFDHCRPFALELNHLSGNRLKANRASPYHCSPL